MTDLLARKETAFVLWHATPANTPPERREPIFAWEAKVYALF
jgi:hypothetical protein